MGYRFGGRPRLTGGSCARRKRRIGVVPSASAMPTRAPRLTLLRARSTVCRKALVIRARAESCSPAFPLPPVIDTVCHLFPESYRTVSKSLLTDSKRFAKSLDMAIHPVRRALDRRGKTTAWLSQQLARRGVKAARNYLDTIASGYYPPGKKLSLALSVLLDIPIADLLVFEYRAPRCAS